MMSGVKYTRAQTLEEAIALLDRENVSSMVIAGGTDLVVYLREGKLNLDEVIDITEIKDLTQIELSETGELHIGAAVSHTEVAGNPEIRRLAPVLADASASVGAVQIRNLGTIGGNVANAAVAADTLPALAALDARLEVAGKNGMRQLSLDEFFLGPGTTSLGKDQLLTKIIVPAHPEHRHCFIKVARRRAAAISRLSVAVMIGGEDMVRIAVGAILPTPQRIGPAEKSFLDASDTTGIEDAGRSAVQYVRSISGERPSMRYKLPVVGSAISKALRKALKETGGER